MATTVLDSRPEERRLAVRSPAALATLVVVLAALAIRLWLMPPLANQPQYDEPAYMIDGLLMLESATPGDKFAPGAVTVWPGFVYGALSSLSYLVYPTEEIAKQPTVFKPLYAIDRALFDAYADYSGLRAVVMGTVLLTTLFGVFMACRLGAYRAGWPGAVLCGGLMAFTPVIALLSVEARPYAAAWSFGLAAVAFAAILSGRWRWIAAGLCFGLAVASRIELVLIAPLVAWEFWLRPEKSMPLRALLRAAGISIVTFLLAAPWYITHLVGNIRKVLTVSYEPTMQDNGGLASGLLDLLWSEGLLAVAVVILIGLALRPGRERILAAAGGLFIVAVLLAFGGGGLAKYNGAAWISIIAFAPYALASLQERFSGRVTASVAGLVAVLLVLPAAAQTVGQGLAFRAGWVEPKVVEWLAKNVPAGTPVYSYPRQIRAIPPTAESAERSWLEVAHPNAWREKLRKRLKQTDLTMDRLPGALSLDQMYQRLGPARRSFFLAAPHWGDQPRYDVRIRGYVYRPSTKLATVVEEFLQTGGVLVHHGEPVSELGEPAAAWLAKDRTGMFVYLRPVSGS